MPRLNMIEHCPSQRPATRAACTHRLGFGIVAMACASIGVAPFAARASDDNRSRPPADDVAAAAEYLQSVADSMRVKPQQGETRLFELRRAPLLKYSDPARGYLAAGMWRLGDAGRPKAFVSLEYWVRAEVVESNEPRLMFEFMAIAPAKFELNVEKDGTKWQPDGTVPEFSPLREAPRPASSDQQRLIQMRALLRRFTVSEKNKGEFASLRLMPQPIDRYKDPDEQIQDGAAFVFAYGTNPELVMLLESTGDAWRYSIMRMSWAELVVELDGNETARLPQLMGFPASGPYRSSGHVIPSSERARVP